MNHRLIIGALAALPLLAASLSAQAADMPLYKAPPPAPVPFSWTGFYIGAHVGGAWGTREFNFNDLTAAAPFLWDSSVPVSGPLAGGQIGANWQAGWAVLGVEADGSWANLQGRSLCNTTTFFLNCAAKTDGLATVTGRLGVDLDRTLVYVKGGGAWMHENSTISNVALPPLATGFSSSISNDRTGWPWAWASNRLRHALVGKARIRLHGLRHQAVQFPGHQHGGWSHQLRQLGPGRSLERRKGGRELPLLILCGAYIFGGTKFCGAKAAR